MARRAAAAGVAAAGPKRKPVWREVEERESGRLANRARSAVRRRRRIAVVYDIEGPRVRLGIGWFVLLLVALATGLALVTAVYAAAAALAGAQTARAWQRRRGGHRPDGGTATVGAAALPVAAAVSTALLGLAVLGVVVVAFVVAAGRRGPTLPMAARTLQCSLWAGGAAAAVVCCYRFEIGAAVALVLAVSAYETGDYLIGTGGRSAVEGPIAGAAAVLVVQFGVSALGVPPFELPAGLGYAVLAAGLCPIGQLVASLVLPSAKSPASALRRLDSLLVLAPVWALVAGAAAATGR